MTGSRRFWPSLHHRRGLLPSPAIKPLFQHSLLEWTSWTVITSKVQSQMHTSWPWVSHPSALITLTFANICYSSWSYQENDLFCKHWPFNLVSDIEDVVQSRVGYLMFTYWRLNCIHLNMKFLKYSTSMCGKWTLLPGQFKFTRLQQPASLPTLMSTIPAQRTTQMAVILQPSQPTLWWTQSGRPNSTSLGTYWRELGISKGFTNPHRLRVRVLRVRIQVVVCLPMENPYPTGSDGFSMQC